MQSKLKEEKQKVTLYLPQELHKQLKIRAAVDSETMTDIAQKAIIFYLSNPEVVEQYSTGYGHSHRVYNCPECASHLAMRQGEIVSLNERFDVLVDDSISSVGAVQPMSIDSQDEGELVPC